MSSTNRKILIASGVNLDLLGRREPSIYGESSLRDMEKLVKVNFASFQRQDSKQAHRGHKYKLCFFQSNDEAKFLKELDQDFAGAVINAGAWTHTSLALADRLVGLGLPFVEAHVSNLETREPFRQHSYLSKHAICVIQGHGIKSYWLGLEALLAFLQLNPTS